MNQQLASLKQYIKLKYGGNQSEFARDYGIKPSNVARMFTGLYVVDMTDGTLYLRARNQQLKGANNE